MNLILEIINTPSVDIYQKTMRFDKNGGKIGRSKSATWRLNDPTKHISNLHAEITFQNGQYYITDISSNGMHLESPRKKLVKGVPVPITQQSRFLIGEYIIGVKTIESSFSEQAPLGTGGHNKPAQAGIPDTYFFGDQTKESFGIIEEESASERDVLSMVGNEPFESHNMPSDPPEMMLPELDDFLDSFDDEKELVINDSLSTHIEAPTFETPDETFNAPENPSQVQQHYTSHANKLIKILSVKLDIDIEQLTPQEQEKFISELADTTLTSLDKLKHTYTALEKIQQQLGISPQNQYTQQDLFKTSINAKEMLKKLHLSTPPLSQNIKEIYQEIDIHTIAFYTAFKNLSLKNAEKFSPEKLYFRFEKENKLSKNFANKKALAWEAYCNCFNHLNDIKDETIDMEELQKEYISVLETLKLGYNT